MPDGARSPVTSSPGPTETGVLGPPPAGAMSAYPRPAGVRPHILVVNGRKVRQPVFIIGAPHSGADLLARALKRSAGFHVTIGQRSVIGANSVVTSDIPAFSIAAGAPARVLRTIEYG